MQPRLHPYFPRTSPSTRFRALHLVSLCSPGSRASKKLSLDLTRPYLVERDALEELVIGATAPDPFSTFLFLLFPPFFAPGLHVPPIHPRLPTHAFLVMSLFDDRRRADLFEVELRRKVGLDPRNTWELIWLLRLPLEVRCSYSRILEARIDQDSTRQSLFRQSCYRQRDWRVREPTLDCMTLEPVHKSSHSWASIGRRQRRKPTRPGRTATRRPRHKPATPTPTLAPVPERPPTPEGLRAAVWASGSLPLAANGPIGHAPMSPREPSPPPTPRVVTRVVRRPPSPVAPPEPHLAYEGETVIDGVEVDWRLAYVIALGRHSGCRWRSPISLQRAAQDILDAERLHPGVMTQLLDIFFPYGLDDLSLARPKLLYLLDFCRGWFELAPDSFDRWDELEEDHSEEDGSEEY